ncbi:MAG: tetratricopeptide repeat protein [Gemmataceae bacterium]
MRRVAFAAVTAAVVVAFGTSAQPPKGDPLAEPRQRLHRGNYEEARAGFAAAAKDHAPAAAIGTARAWRAEGEYAKALDALKDAAGNPDLLAARADLLFSLGKWDDALADAAAALAKQPDHVLARWVKARLLRDKGDVPAADAEVKWFVRLYSDAENADRPITDPDTLLIVGQAGVENATWNNRPQQFQFVLNEVYKDAKKHDPDCWEAEYLAGSLLLEKHNRAQALEAFDAALKINPRAADALAAKGQAALDALDLTVADRLADAALKVNPRHPAALRLKADVFLAGGDVGTARRLLLAAKQVNPRDEATLARLAATARLANDAAAFDAVVKEVEGFDAKPAAFYHDLAGVLDARKQYGQAEAYFRKAAELRPQLPAAKAGLGMLLLRTGREPEAKVVLDAAFKADPFNVRVSNSRLVLKHLEAYQTVETPHYVVRFDPKADRLLAPFLAEYLEDVHAGFARDYGFSFDGKVVVEVFSSREMFSGRTIALPGLPDVAAGACTGRVVAFPSPTADKLNWSRVVRHELTHAFNLLQTDYRVPHWLTEGLAVRSEGGERPLEWMAVLRERHAAAKLFDLDTITLGFVRPRTPDDWPLAYLQSLLYVEYLTKTHGQPAVGKLLDAYRGGATTTAALKAAVGVEQGAFEAGYRAFVTEVVRGKGARREKALTFAELEAAQKERPDDPDLMARLAGEYARRNKAADAKRLIDAALAAEPGHPLASVLKARMLDAAAGRAVLEAAAKENPDDSRVLLALGRALTAAKEYDAAAAVFERGRKASPEGSDWLPELARLYTVLKKADPLADVLAEMTARDPDDLPARLRLARLRLDGGNPGAAERAAREALRLDLAHEEARALLLAALRAQKKDAEADRIARRYE